MFGFVILFQSTPAISDGRRSHGADATGQESTFQSTPAISDGRRTSCKYRSLIAWLFNPPTPFLTGAGFMTIEQIHCYIVSIHARHF